MLPILSEITVETACEWLQTVVKVREARLRRAGDKSEVSLSAAFIDLQNRRNGHSTISGVLRGRFDERVRESRQRKGEMRVYFEALPTIDIAVVPQVPLTELFDGLTEREHRIAKAKLDGHTDLEIAVVENLSERRIGQVLAEIQKKIRN